MKKIFEIFTMVALLIWGAVFIYFYFSGRVEAYLSPSFRVFVPIAGAGMILLGAFNLITVNKMTGVCVHDHAGGDSDHENHHHDHDHHHHDHDHGDEEHHHHEEATASSLAFALLVLLVPVLTAAKFSPDRFSSDYTRKWAEIETDMQKMRQRKAAEERRQQIAENGGNPHAESGDSNEGDEWGEFTLEDLKKMVPQTDSGDFLLDIAQIFYTAGDEELMGVMEGISVEADAQVIEDTMDGAPSNRLRAYRLLIECCAADARPVSIPIDFTEAVPEYKDMGWYKLIGRLHFSKGEDFEYTPILQIKTFEEIPEPDDWMSRF